MLFKILKYVYIMAVFVVLIFIYFIFYKKLNDSSKI